ncbi:DNA polymerase III subunit beta [Leptolyngbya sp. 'hensonii']|uniref:DNA polymerase III subunit beta n=1 Tax=Leptolyngbya sp. 'hensonii' TaxID=1922337 RepID=UPI00094FD747|nr:DNA polymerase III subunit beta [Leptolyngbya sp. 'hensonii']OLP18241.1 DNA polymerase III subunit beta [Leptolyngbya sp. 'hensonii']
MRLVCAQTDLNTHLSLVSRAVPSRPTHPVLANVLLTADVEAQQVSLTAFDLSLGIRTSFPAQVDVPGEMTLPAKLLNDIVSRLPSGEITLEQTQTDAEASILANLVSTSGRYQMRGMGASDFPELPAVESGEVLQLPIEGLLEGCRGVLFATSTDESKQILTGVHLTLQVDGLEFAATDGHRLAVMQTVMEVGEEASSSRTRKAGSKPEINVTIPAKALRELERMLSFCQAGTTVAVQLNLGQVVFELGNQCLTSRLLEGQYPNYNQLIPRQFGRQMTIERRLFLGALERIAVLADQKNNVVKLSLDAENQELTLSVEAQDVGSGRETIPAQISGETVDIAFNVKYLAEGLKAIETSEVQMQLNTATSPVIVTPVGGGKMTYLVMPVQIRS